MTASQELSKPEYTQEQLDRAFSFAMHLDAEFLQRGNFFLLGESMLVVAYAGILTAGPTVLNAENLPWVARVVAIFGILLALLWAFIQSLHKAYLESVAEHVRQLLPEYAEIRTFRLKRNIPNSFIMAYVIPTMTAAMWITLIALSF